jgi:hypothetical protein
MKPNDPTEALRVIRRTINTDVRAVNRAVYLERCKARVKAIRAEMKAAGVMP